MALGGLHVTSLPAEARAHADTIFLGPGEDTWPAFLADFRAGRPAPAYASRVRTLDGLPPIRRDLVRRELYLVPNSIVVSRGCPHVRDFCSEEAFFEGGRGDYTQRVDAALAEIERLPGRHLYFLDDHLFGDPRFAAALFGGMRGMGRLWQAAGTVASVLKPGLVERAVECGLRSLFVGFEKLDPEALQRKHQNLHRDYARAVRRLHDLGVMAGRLRHLAYAGGWKKLEPLWDAVIRLRRVSGMLPVLEKVLEGRPAPAARTIAGCSAKPWPRRSAASAARCP